MTQPPQPSPAISAVVVAPFGCAHVAKLIGLLAAQTIRSRLEVVLMIPSREDLDGGTEAALIACGAHQVVETGPIQSLPRVRADGIRAARAPVVVLTEDHCFPEPGWAEALVRGHEGPWAAVGPVFAPPVPWRACARAGSLMQYAPWMDPVSGGEVSDLPGHNSSYKRDLLLAYGDSLDAMMAFETVLHWDLRRRGHRLWLEPAARVRHVYMAQWRASVVENYYIARGFAGARTRTWSLPRRAAFVLASPLIPAVRFARLCPRAIALGWLRDIPALAALLVVSAVGEAMGSAFGPGRAAAMSVELDTRRYRFVSPADRAAIWAEETPAAPSPARTSSNV